MLKASGKSSGPPVVGAHLTSLALPGKPESVVSLTSQCSYSSTIVHVGDKKTQPELGRILLIFISSRWQVLASSNLRHVNS